MTLKAKLFRFLSACGHTWGSNCVFQSYAGPHWCLKGSSSHPGPHACHCGAMG